MNKFLVVIFSILSLSSKGQVGNMFPSLTGKTLENKTITIPVDTKNKYTLIGMAYSQKSDSYLQGWFQPVFDVFLNKKALFTYDVNMFFIPMIGGLKQMAAETIEKKMKTDVDKKLHSNVLLYKGNVTDYKKALNFDGKDKPYFFILDKAGKIVYATSGEYTEKKMEEIEDHLEEVME